MKHVKHRLLLTFFIYSIAYAHETQKEVEYPAQNKISVSAEISVGELIDKITILEIKKARMNDFRKVQNVETELTSLNQTLQENIEESEQLRHLKNLLKEINESLWEIEDQIREEETRQIFDQKFIQLAREVYYTNDKRAEIKREINQLMGSRIIEEKQYTSYN